jgi:hypothetical protein
MNATEMNAVETYTSKKSDTNATASLMLISVQPLLVQQTILVVPNDLYYDNTDAA